MDMEITQKTLSRAGRELIKRHEGLSLRAYLCPANRLSIGYGHVLLPKFDHALFGLTAEALDRIIKTCQARKKLTLEAYAMRISEDDADVLMQRDAEQVARFLASVLTMPLRQNQFDALVSLVFNIGQGAFAKSTLRKKLYALDYAGAAAEFSRWVYASVEGKQKPLPGLVKRRAEERALFEKP
jgi:lysozyme